jgi:hypothetical protein
MDGDLKDILKDIRESISTGHGRLEGKLDSANKQFNQHLVDDAKFFTALEINQKRATEQIDSLAKVRKEDSERTLKKAEDDKREHDQLRYLRIAGYWAIAAAIIGILGGSVLSWVEARASRQLLEQRIPGK